MKKTNKILSVFLALLMVFSIIPMATLTVSAAELSRKEYDMSIGTSLVSVESHGVVKNEIDLLDYDGGFAVYPDESTTITYQIVVKQQTHAQNVVVEEVAIYYDANLTIADTTYDVENISDVNIGGQHYKKGIISDICLPDDGSYAGRVEIIISFESPLGYLEIFNDFYCEIYLGDSEYSDTDSVPGNALKSNEFDIGEDDSAAFSNPHNLQAAPYGLKYEIKEEKLYITDFIGNKNLDCLYIPSEINGYPVYQINSDAFLDNTGMMKKIFIPSSVTNILSGAFRYTGWNEGATDTPSVEEVIISEGVKWVGSMVFYNCSNISKVNFPSTISCISPASISGYKFYGSLLSSGLYLYSEMPNPSLERIYIIDGSYADYYFNSIETPEGINAFSQVVVNSEKVYTVNYNYSYNGGSWIATETRPRKAGESIDLSLKAYCGNREFVGWNTDPTATTGLKNLQMGNGDITLYAIYDTYNLGEETYSFDNFGDSDSASGHCFGMSMTSAAYYNNILDITDVGGNTIDDVYGLSKNTKVKAPICYYQAIQGDYSRYAIVAGGTFYLSGYKYNNIQSDWEEVINYVSNHNYDNKGNLQIGFRKSNQGGHAINFLRYEVVNGQERIYAYDNNFPNTETYFYKAADGNIYQAPYSTFKGAIDCITLRDVNKYFDIANDYDTTRYIYGNTDSISITGAVAHPMECGDNSYTMFEIPDGVDRIVITPLTDNASFQYCDDEYSFGNVDDDTFGILTLATENDENMADNFVVINVTLTIQEPSRTSIRNKDGIILHANIDGTAPAGSYVEWTWNNSKFDVEKNSDGTLTIISENNGKTTFTATLFSADGDILATDTIEMTSKAGFFDKIGGFFRSLFGTTKIYEY